LRTPAWSRLVLLLGFLKLSGVVAALALLHASLVSSAVNPLGLPPIFDGLTLVALGGGAILLLVLGRADSRAVWLGGCFLFAADAVAQQLVARNGAALAGLADLFGGLRLDVLMPLFLWRFVREFPHVPTPVRLRRFVEVGIRTAAVAAALLLGVYLMRCLLLATAGTEAAGGAGPASWAPLAPLSAGTAALLRQDGLLSTVHRSLLALLTAAALPVLVWRSHLATGEERRRARLFGLCAVAGLAPAAAVLLAAALSPGFSASLRAHRPLGTAPAILAGLLLLSLPVSTSYVVLKHRAVGVRLLARALQYALARASVLTLATLPLAAVVVYFYQNRERSLENLLSSSRMPLLLAVSGLGIAAHSFRRPLLDWIDRRFFREQYDARQILSMLVERIRAIREAADLAKLIAREVDLALHLERIALLFTDPRTGMLKDPNDRTRRLDASSALAGLISSGSDPLTNDLEDPRSPLARLPEKDRQWLTDSGFRLLVPILARDGSLLGMIGLADKKSGLPFLKEDRQLLHSIASSAAWVLELEQSRTATPRSAGTRLPGFAQTTPADPLPVTEVAKECPVCGTLYQPYTVFCGSCSRRLDPSHVPFVLPGKFRFERRIGSGGMGVVYSGADLSLGRPVAAKTMRRVSPEDAMRLRREARTAASVAHPHLASIYGIETWQGTPMLILEMLEGGTLAQRIERERLSEAATVDLGISMAEALAQLHAADILHRDVKPSNIGFSRDGVPKLMDFGIARVMFDLRRDGRMDAIASPDNASGFLPPTSILNQTATSLDLSRQFAGTLSYLSPEALNGQRADAQFDLWSLAIVLYECLLGRKVFGVGDMRQITTRIRLGRVPDFAQVCPEYHPALAEFFRAALHRTAARRPGSALELRRLLETVRTRLNGGV
jgi:hypothetical protein